MKRRLLEGSVLFVSIVKWVFLASCVGVVVGLSTAAFLSVLQKGIDVTSEHPNFFLLLPVSFAVSAALVKYFAPEVLRFFGWLRRRLRWSEIPVALLGGTTLAILALLFSKRYLGLGLETISSALVGQETPSRPLQG